MRPRIVPCFARELGAYGGETMAAFRRGRALYRESAALERLAANLRVKPLSASGFADDCYEQDVTWHSAIEGIRSIEALLREVDSRCCGSPRRTACRSCELARSVRAASGNDREPARPGAA